MIVWLVLTGVLMVISFGYFVVGMRRRSDSYLILLGLVVMMGAGLTAFIYGALDSA